MRSDEGTVFSLNENQKTKIKDRLYSYVQSVVKDDFVKKDKKCQNLLEELKNTFYNQFYAILENKNILISKDSITEILTEINNCMIKEMDVILCNNNKHKWKKIIDVGARKEFLKKSFLNFKKDELRKILSVETTTFNSDSSAFNNEKLLYINKIKNKLERNNFNFQNIFDINQYMMESEYFDLSVIYYRYDGCFLDVYINIFKKITQSLCEINSEKLLELSYTDNGVFYIIDPEIIFQIFEMMNKYRSINPTLFYDIIINCLVDKN